jgi:hypothetical protein
VNPDVYEDFTIARYDLLLGKLHSNGLAGILAKLNPALN